jgi:site-specific DNA-methyltransferase (adenine-specific)
MQPYYSQSGITIYHGDCLEIMPTLTEQVDAVIADPPYGTTACSWDTVIPFVPMWTQIKRLVKPRAAVVLFGSQPFTSALVMSNPKWFKYQWVWRKSRPTSFVHAKNMPMRITEDIAVFSQSGMGHESLLGDSRMSYNPQGLVKVDRILRQSAATRAPGTNGIRPSHKDIIHQEFTNYPINLLEYDSVSMAEHPTQKPLDLLRYLILTYTNPGDTVLDFTMGSGTTLVAAKQLGRQAIGIELDERYCEIAANRLQQEVMALV